MPTERFVQIDGKWVAITELPTVEKRICSGCRKPMELDEKFTQLYVNIVDSKTVGQYGGEIHDTCFPQFIDRIREMESHRW